MRLLGGKRSGYALHQFQECMAPLDGDWLFLQKCIPFVVGSQVDTPSHILLYPDEDEFLVQSSVMFQFKSGCHIKR